MPPPETSRPIARDLLRIEAVRLAVEEPFTWSSGMRAPIYCDNRLTLGHPDVRGRISEGFADVISERALRPELVAGTTTAGIPHAAWLAHRLALPMAYVRSEAKGHGRAQRIEGGLQKGQRVVLVEDLVSTGGSAIEAAQALHEAGADVQAVLAIFTYELEAARDRFAEAPFPLVTLTGFSALLHTAHDAGALDAAALGTLRRWREDPQAWSRKV